jgi:hypothetical protein
VCFGTDISSRSGGGSTAVGNSNNLLSNNSCHRLVKRKTKGVDTMKA